MKEIAIKVVNKLKQNGVPAFLFGSVARDILLNRCKGRKDIDIIITSNEKQYMLVTRSVMKSFGGTLIAEAYFDSKVLSKEVWIVEEDDKEYVIDIHYVVIMYDIPLPRPIKGDEHNYIILPPDLLFYTMMMYLSKGINKEKKKEVFNDIEKLFTVRAKIRWL